LADRRAELALPSPQTETLHHVLRSAFDEVRARKRPDRVHTALQMLWVDELLESQTSMQADLLTSADLFRRRRHGLLI
jgi:rRNA pseudouridine-1189 N-methylase Emg1 (Nep1/Mra1 family)